MITTSWLGKDSQEWRERDLTFDEDAKTLTFDTTVKNVDEIDKLGSVEAVKAAIAGPTPTLVVTPKMVDDMIEAIQVQYRDEKTDFYCETAKILWDALDDAGKDKVKEGGYFADPTGDAEADDTLNADGISEKEILVVSFGTSFNDSRAQDIGGVEKAIAAANPDWSVRRAFTAQIIINHVQ
ncbi:MAG: sirohydrochlorin cobaltochelatase, partial [Eggerthellaceae bacterium]|nr:sirohydrochlorin cobaltochelatase [Eggerthellaceae bacterium]